MTLLQEPYKHQTSNQADGALVVVFLIIRFVFNIIRELNLCDCPSIPVAQFAIEVIGQNLNRETLV